MLLPEEDWKHRRQAATEIPVQRHLRRTQFDTLYVTSSDKVYKRKTKTIGTPWFVEKAK